MSESHIQEQINGINQKLDLILEEIHLQKQRREQVDDLMTDLNLVSRDAFKASVEMLDNAGVELDGDALRNLLMKFIRNIGMLNDLFDLMESAYDFTKDAGPIVQQMGLDAIHKMGEMESKGYVDFIKEGSRVVDQVVTNFSAEDIRQLSDNVVLILQTLKNLTQPQMLKAMDNAISVYQHIETDNIPEYSIWGAFKELRKPEMKKGMGFIITFLKNLSKQTGSEQLTKQE
jgi:uncharacterized protein YjgD (DUF1641 family)